MIRASRRNEEGYVLITALIALAVMTILGAVAIAQATTALRMTRQAVRTEQALYMANAGAEFILARVQTATPPEVGVFYGDTLPLEPGLTGSYSVYIEERQEGFIWLHSTGFVQDASGEQFTRQVEAEIPLDLAGGGGGGGTGGGGDGGQGGAFVWGNGPLTLGNQMDVCGDLYSTGDITLGTQVRVWGTTGGDSPCTTIAGTGKVVAQGRLAKGPNTTIDGGWCDSTHYGAPYACDAPPQVQTMPTPAFATLKSTATRWYVAPGSGAFCDGKPAGSCAELPEPEKKNDSVSLALGGAQSYQEDLVYVEGDLVVQRNDPLRITGTVTFAVTGSVYLEDDLVCAAGPGRCNVAVIASGDIAVTSTQVEVHSILQTAQTLRVKNQDVIWGTMVASDFDFETGVTLYPYAGDSWPPGVPHPPAPTPEPGPDEPAVPTYSHWKQ